MTVHVRQQTPSLLHVDSIVAKISGPEAIAEVCRFLRHEFAHYGWVGVYRLEGETLVLAGWNGEQPTEHTRIPVDRGICGKAVRDGRSIVVDDVRAEPEYLACFRETRSEIVVPIRRDGKIIGEIDIDGNDVKAYDASDVKFLEAVAERLAPRLAP